MRGWWLDANKYWLIIVLFNKHLSLSRFLNLLAFSSVIFSMQLLLLWLDLFFLPLQFYSYFFLCMNSWVCACPAVDCRRWIMLLSSCWFSLCNWGCGAAHELCHSKNSRWFDSDFSLSWVGVTSFLIVTDFCHVGLPLCVMICRISLCR